MSEVHIFTGIATSLDQQVTNYPVGERHSLMIFLRQSIGSDHDWDAAEALVVAASWGEVDLKRGGTLTTEDTLGDFQEMYDTALSNGGAIVVYSEPEK